MANASKSIPTPVMAQPINNAAGLATAAIFWGRLKTPAPSIELKTSAVSALSPSFFPLVFSYKNEIGRIIIMAKRIKMVKATKARDFTERRDRMQRPG
ncbi:hypothetical protein [Salmonella enterica]|uniref:hypothetical protein n=1 Tax=Salmonella enterica TaxID=28901 RepID=UPI001D0C9391|nr:hypothetical protein [Salmonella enterica]